MNMKETIMNTSFDSTKKCVENLYYKYMTEVCDGMIDDVANSLIGIIAELEALKLRMHSSYDEERLRNGAYSNNAMDCYNAFNRSDIIE